MDIYGLLGEKLSHSLSPKIHNELLKSIEEQGIYKLFEIDKDSLLDFVKAIKLLKVKGCNVTIPYKKEIIKYIDEISKEVNSIGAINTIYLKDNKLYGYNTDYFGFGYLMKKANIDIKGKNAVILGNGGAAQAVLHYLLDNLVNKIYIVTRDKNKSNINLSNVNIISYEELEHLSGDILINTTPVGMYPNINKSPVEKEIVKNFTHIVDLIYNPMETLFIKYAKELKKNNISGLYMLIGQAVKAQEIWNNKEIQSNIIEDIYIKLSESGI